MGKLFDGIDNGTAEDSIAPTQLAGAICKATRVPRKLVTYDEAGPRVSEFLVGFLWAEDCASNQKAKNELGWRIEGMVS